MRTSCPSLSTQSSSSLLCQSKTKTSYPSLPFVLHPTKAATHLLRPPPSNFPETSILTSGGSLFLLHTWILMCSTHTLAGTHFRTSFIATCMTILNNRTDHFHPGNVTLIVCRGSATQPSSSSLRSCSKYPQRIRNICRQVPTAHSGTFCKIHT